MSNKLIEALGADDENDALRIVAEANQFIGDALGATGKKTLSEARTRINAALALAVDVESATEQPAAKALGTVLAWKESHEQLPKAQEELSEAREDVRKRDVEALIEKGRKAGQLTPATADYWRERPADQLESFLACAPRVMPKELKEVEERAADATAASVTTEDGLRYEDLRPAQKASLKRSDPELYEALRDDWTERGEPSAA